MKYTGAIGASFAIVSGVQNIASVTIWSFSTRLISLSVDSKVTPKDSREFVFIVSETTTKLRLSSLLYGNYNNKRDMVHYTFISPSSCKDDFGNESFNRSDNMQCFLAGVWAVLITHWIAWAGE